MSHATAKCFDLQGDRPKIAGEMVLAMIHLVSNYSEKKEYNVINVNDPDEWVPNKAYDNLPRIKMTTCEDVAEAKGIQ